MNAISHPVPAEQQSDFTRLAHAALQLFFVRAEQRILDMDPGSPVSDGDRADATRESGRHMKALTQDADAFFADLVDALNTPLGAFGDDDRKGLHNIVSAFGIEVSFDEAADLLDMGRAA